MRYRISTGINSPAHRAAEALYPLIKDWSNTYLLGVEYSGSYAKGTTVRGSADVDLFISLSPNTSETLRDIYNGLATFVQSRGYSPRRQNVSLGITYQGIKIDLVPAKKHWGHTNDHILYRNRTGTWIKTNIHQHINLVKNSGRTEEIRLIKIWRNLHNLDFPSMYLELSVLRALHGKGKGHLDRNTWTTLEYLANNFEYARIVDPANTNNVISDELSRSGKSSVAQAARLSLRACV